MTSRCIYFTTLRLVIYFLKADSITAKANFLAKVGRERRNLERQRAKFMTKEEIERTNELQRRKEV